MSFKVYILWLFYDEPYSLQLCGSMGIHNVVLKSIFHFQCVILIFLHLMFMFNMLFCSLVIECVKLIR